MTIIVTGGRTLFRRVSTLVWYTAIDFDGIMVGLNGWSTRRRPSIFLVTIKWSRCTTIIARGIIIDTRIIKTAITGTRGTIFVVITVTRINIVIIGTMATTKRIIKIIGTMAVGTRATTKRITKIIGTMAVGTRATTKRITKIIHDGRRHDGHHEEKALGLEKSQNFWDEEETLQE